MRGWTSFAVGFAEASDSEERSDRSVQSFSERKWHILEGIGLK